jgi:hypothetical protein
VNVPQPAPVQPVAQSTGAPVNEETLQTLIAISGKPRDLCVRALQATQGNPDVAFELLMSGLPPGQEAAAM